MEAVDDTTTEASYEDVVGVEADPTIVAWMTAEDHVVDGARNTVAANPEIWEERRDQGLGLMGVEEGTEEAEVGGGVMTDVLHGIEEGEGIEGAGARTEMQADIQEYTQDKYILYCKISFM